MFLEFNYILFVDMRSKYIFVILLVFLSLGQIVANNNEISDESFIEIPKNIRKIVKFLNESEIPQGPIKQNKIDNTEKSYEILYIDPISFTENNRSNKTMERITTGPNLGVTYTWARWGKWAKCSRTCGGGIQIRKRFCIERRPYGTDMELNSFEPMVDNIHKGCVGIFKRYRICNDKECPNQSDGSYRDEQCSTYNDAPFRGKFYDWESYSKDNNECELNCKPIGLNYYTTLNKTVINGTPCKRPAIYYTHFYRHRAVCIEGICKAVHSSGAVRAATTKDSSFKCGSVLCRPVSETFTKENLPKGFLYITTLSTGASNISIIQVDKSENFLVLKAADDHFIINGDDEPSTTGIYKYHGNSFDYKRGDDFQTITCEGPTTRAIDLMILVNGINPGIKYEYYLPVASAGITDSEEDATQWNELGVPLDYLDETNQVEQQEANLQPSANDKRKRNFMWKLIGFSPCSKSCGGGKQAPIFRCIRDSPTRFYTPRRCMHTEKPVFHDIIYQCNTQPCPAYWFSEDWSDCFCQGNRGTHRRIVKCVQELQGGVAVQVENDQCLEEKPPIKEYCPCPVRPIMPTKIDKPRIYEHLRGNVQSITHFKNTTMYNDRPYHKNHQHQYRQIGFREDKSDKTGVWLHSNWNQHCSIQCGMGVEHRSIFCDRTVPYTDRCDLISTPDTTRSCKGLTNCETSGSWFTGNWSECHGDCFNLYRLRKVVCIKENIIVDHEECTLENKPMDKEICKLDDVNYCKARWHYSEWTDCSRQCGGGTQKRFVKCLEIEPIENILRESKNCRYVEREPVYSTCNTDNCPSSDKFSTDHHLKEMDNELKSICSDEFTNCHLISNKNKGRLCKLNYYQKNCCRSCNGF